MPQTKLLASNDTLKASTRPIEAINKHSYRGQDPMRRMYRPDYENFFEALPVLRPDDPLLKPKVEWSIAVMRMLAAELRDSSWIHELEPDDNGFNRTILAISEAMPVPVKGLDGGPQIVMARWGNGFTNPPHGHAQGLMFDEILIGKMKQNNYRLMPSGKARLAYTEIIKAGDVIAGYAPPSTGVEAPRPYHLHSLVSIGFTASLHYVPEYSRDGRDNVFQVEHFHQYYDLDSFDVKRITSKEAMYLPKGSVVLVRSENVPEYGDHYIVITGAPVMKAHGLRPQDFAIDATGVGLLDKFTPQHGLTLLQLQGSAHKEFLAFHGITIDEEGNVSPAKVV